MFSWARSAKKDAGEARTESEALPTSATAPRTTAKDAFAAGSHSSKHALTAAAEDAGNPCAAELGAHKWRLRCLKADAFLRLARQRRRGEQHPRWPEDAEALERLRDTCRRLEAEAAEELERCVLGSFRELTSLGAAAATAEAGLRTEEVALQRYRTEAAEDEALFERLVHSEASEDAVLREREGKLQEREALRSRRSGAARRLGERLRAQRSTLEALSEQRAQIKLEAEEWPGACARLEAELEEGTPELRKLSEECTAACSEAERARTAVQKRSEAVARVEAEVDESWQHIEERERGLQQELADMRTEVSELRSSKADRTTQLRRSKYNHTQELQAAKNGGQELRGAVEGMETERALYTERLGRARGVTDRLDASAGLRRAREQNAAFARDKLLEKIEVATGSIAVFNDEQYVLDNDCSALHEELDVSLRACSEACMDHQRARAEEQSSARAAVELRCELARLQEELHASTTEELTEQAHRFRKEIEQAQAEHAEHTACETSWREDTQRIQGRREREQVQKRAATEAMSRLRIFYSELLRDIRAGKAKGAALDFTSGASKSARNLGHYIADLSHFLESVSACGEWSAQELILPDILRDAFTAAHEKSPRGLKYMETLGAEQDKAAALLKKDKEAATSHAAEVGRLGEQAAILREELEECEAHLLRIAERAPLLGPAVATKGELEEIQAGICGPITEIQEEIKLYTNEMACLREERSELSATLGVTDEAWTPAAIEETTQQLKQAEFDVFDLRSRVAAARDRYEELLSETWCSGEPRAEAAVLAADAVVRAADVPGTAAEEIGAIGGPTSAEMPAVSAPVPPQLPRSPGQPRQDGTSVRARQPNPREAAASAAVAAAGLSVSASPNKRAAAAMAAAAAAIASAPTPPTPTPGLVPAATAAVAAALETVRVSQERRGKSFPVFVRPPVPGAMAEGSPANASGATADAIVQAETIMRQILSGSSGECPGGAAGPTQAELPGKDEIYVSNPQLSFGMSYGECEPSVALGSVRTLALPADGAGTGLPSPVLTDYSEHIIGSAVLSLNVDTPSCTLGSGEGTDAGLQREQEAEQDFGSAEGAPPTALHAAAPSGGAIVAESTTGFQSVLMSSAASLSSMPTLQPGVVLAVPSSPPRSPSRSPAARAPSPFAEATAACLHSVSMPALQSIGVLSTPLSPPRSPPRSPTMPSWAPPASAGREQLIAAHARRPPPSPPPHGHAMAGGRLAWTALVQSPQQPDRQRWPLSPVLVSRNALTTDNAVAASQYTWSTITSDNPVVMPRARSPPRGASPSFNVASPTAGAGNLVSWAMIAVDAMSPLRQRNHTSPPRQGVPPPSLAPWGAPPTMSASPPSPFNTFASHIGGDVTHVNTMGIPAAMPMGLAHGTRGL